MVWKVASKMGWLLLWMWCIRFFFVTLFFLFLISSSMTVCRHNYLPCCHLLSTCVIVDHPSALKRNNLKEIEVQRVWSFSASFSFSAVVIILLLPPPSPLGERDRFCAASHHPKIWTLCLSQNKIATSCCALLLATAGVPVLSSSSSEGCS